MSCRLQDFLSYVLVRLTGSLQMSHTGREHINPGKKKLGIGAKQKVGQIAMIRCSIWLEKCTTCLYVTSIPIVSSIPYLSIPTPSLPFPIFVPKEVSHTPTVPLKHPLMSLTQSHKSPQVCCKFALSHEPVITLLPLLISYKVLVELPQGFASFLQGPIHQ